MNSQKFKFSTFKLQCNNFLCLSMCKFLSLSFFLSLIYFYSPVWSIYASLHTISFVMNVFFFYFYCKYSRAVFYLHPRLRTHSTFLIQSNCIGLQLTTGFDITLLFVCMCARVCVCTCNWMWMYLFIYVALAYAWIL